MKKLSIIIPVYNLEKYIAQTLEICLQQNISMAEYEILCINDGSKDNSANVIAEYQSRYSNIRLYTQENSGVSSARNRGMEIAEGKYIWFVDGDDFISTNCLKSLLEILQTENIDVFGLKMHSVVERIVKEGAVETYQLCPKDENRVNFMTEPGGVGGGVCSQIYKTELLKKHGIRFTPEIKYSEDVLFSFKAVMKAKVCAKTDSVLYYYYQREGSAMHSNNFDKMIDSMHRLANEYKTIAEEEADWADIALSKKYYAIKALLFTMVQKGDVNFAKEKIKELTAEGLYPYPFLKESLRHNVTRKQAVINYVSFFFPRKRYFMSCVRLIALRNKLKRKK